MTHRDATAQLVEQHSVLVSYAVTEVTSRLPAHIDRATLVAGGLVALHETAAAAGGAGGGPTFVAQAKPRITAAVLEALQTQRPRPLPSHLDTGLVERLCGDVCAASPEVDDAIVLGAPVGTVSAAAARQPRPGRGTPSYYAAVAAASDSHVSQEPAATPRTPLPRTGT
jgi:hypothetical protein